MRRDLDVNLTWQFFERAARYPLAVGYRFQNLDYEFDEENAGAGADVDLDGPYLALWSVSDRRN